MNLDHPVFRDLSAEKIQEAIDDKNRFSEEDIQKLIEVIEKAQVQKKDKRYYFDQVIDKIMPTLVKKYLDESCSFEFLHENLVKSALNIELSSLKEAMTPYIRNEIRKRKEERFAAKLKTEENDDRKWTGIPEDMI